MRQPRANRKLLASPGLPLYREFADKCRPLARFAQTLFHWQKGKRYLMPNKVFVGTVVSRTEDEERTQRYRVFEVSELEAEKALRSYLRDRDEKIISLLIRELTRSEAASLNLSSGKVKLLDLST